MAHRNALICPLGALGFHLHFLFDRYKLQEKLDIDWSKNSSWRQVQCFCKDPTIAHMVFSGAIDVWKITYYTL